jgi:hypothetical protein
MKQKDCRHETLKFGSGDYYLFCQSCPAQWVMNRTDGSPDSPYAGGSNIGVGGTLSGQIRRDANARATQCTCKHDTSNGAGHADKCPVEKSCTGAEPNAGTPICST